MLLNRCCRLVNEVEIRKIQLLSQGRASDGLYTQIAKFFFNCWLYLHTGALSKGMVCYSGGEVSSWSRPKGSNPRKSFSHLRSMLIENIPIGQKKTVGELETTLV